MSSCRHCNSGLPLFRNLGLLHCYVIGGERACKHSFTSRRCPMCSVLSFKDEDVAMASFEHVNGRLLIRIEDVGYAAIFSTPQALALRGKCLSPARPAFLMASASSLNLATGPAVMAELCKLFSRLLTILPSSSCHISASKVHPGRSSN